MKRQTLIEVDNDLCWLKAELVEDCPVPFVHAEVKSWGKQQQQLMLFVIDQFKQALHEMGFRKALSLIPDEPKVIKFNSMFGMTEVERGPGLILMQVEV